MDIFRKLSKAIRSSSKNSSSSSSSSSASSSSSRQIRRSPSVADLTAPPSTGCFPVRALSPRSRSNEKLQIEIRPRWASRATDELRAFTDECLGFHVPSELIDLCVKFAKPHAGWDAERRESIGQATWVEHTAVRLGRIFHEARGGADGRFALPTNVLEHIVDFARADAQPAPALAAAAIAPTITRRRELPGISTETFELGRLYACTVRVNVHKISSSPYDHGGRVFGGFIPRLQSEDLWCLPPCATDEQIANPKEGIKFTYDTDGNETSAAAPPAPPSTPTAPSAFAAPPAAPTPAHAYASSTSHNSGSASAPTSSSRRRRNRSTTSTSSSSSNSHTTSSLSSSASSAFSSASSTTPSSSSSSRRRAARNSPPPTKPDLTEKDSEKFTVTWLLDTRGVTVATKGASSRGGASSSSSSLRRKKRSQQKQQGEIQLHSVKVDGTIERHPCEFTAADFPLVFATNDPHVFQIRKLEQDVELLRKQ